MDTDLQTVELGENPRQIPQHVEDKNTKAAEDHGWNNEALQHITAFQSLLSTDIKAAHATIAEIAKIRFGSHPSLMNGVNFFSVCAEIEKGTFSM